MTILDNPALPKGSLVLVTGATGLVGSGVADQFLHYGYKVRGTTRDAVKGAWLQNTFDNKYGAGKFELVSVPDMVADGAYDEVVKGASPLLSSLPPSSFRKLLANHVLRWLLPRRHRCHCPRCIHHDL